MLNTPFSSWPSFTEEESNKISEVLLSNKVNYWTGTECREFEKEFAEYTDTKYAIALSNGTVALDLAFHGLGIQKGDEIIVTSRTFLASVSSIVNAGAKPVFVDLSPDSQNITPENIQNSITAKTKAIVCVHLAAGHVKWMKSCRLLLEIIYLLLKTVHKLMVQNIRVNLLAQLVMLGVGLFAKIKL